jgi:hypothetical protein
MRYIVTNASATPVVVDIVQAGLDHRGRSGQLSVPQESIKGVQEGPDQRSWEVPVAANGKSELTVTFLTAW